MMEIIFVAARLGDGGYGLPHVAFRTREEALEWRAAQNDEWGIAAVRIVHWRVNAVE